MISDTRLEQAMHYLATTDAESAELKGNVARAEYICKSARARAFLMADECRKNVESRKADAETSQLVKEAEESYAEAVVAFEKVRAKRTTETLIVEVWRSLQANRRAAA